MTDVEAERRSNHRREGRVHRWWARRAIKPIDRRQVLDALALRPEANWVFRFGLMQALSVFIAVVGLTGDSAAVVIGAMLIAPLMTPLMALAASLAMGWYRRMVRSAVVVTLASGGSVLLAFLLASAVPGDGITEEVLRRTSPGTGDLVVALAAGVAGAYGTVRSDVSASLPGVAVAVALVPPLATIGVTLEAGERGLASGAGLLFVTNLSAIVLAGVCVFVLTGFVPARRISIARGRLLLGATAVAAAVGLVTVVLAGRTLDAARTAEDVATARRLTTAWLGGSGLDLDGLEVTEGRVAISVSGPEPPPDVAPLAGQFTDLFGTSTDVEVRWSQRTSISPSGSALGEVDPTRLLLVVEDWLGTDGTPASSFTVDVDTDDGVLALDITGPVAAPAPALLELLLVERLGLRVPVLVESTVTSASDETNAERAVIDATVAAWATEQDLSVVDLRETREGVVLEVEGDEPPLSSADLEAAIGSALDRPIEVEIRFRASIVVPTDAFVWPLDCTTAADRPATIPEQVASRGFTGSAAGRWLEARLDETGSAGAAFVDDGTSFLAAYADGVLSVWTTRSPEGSEPGLQRRVDAPTQEGGPRGAELRSGEAGGARVVAVLVPYPPIPNGTATCLPSSDQLDRWFLELLTSAAATPLPPTATSPAGAVGSTGTGSVTDHVHTVGTAAGLPMGQSFAWSPAHSGLERAVIRLELGDVLLEVSPRYPTDDSVDVRRAGGLTLRPTNGAVSGEPAERAVEALIVALAATPWLGVGAG